MPKNVAVAAEDENDDKKKKKKPAKKKLTPDEARLELIRAALGKNAGEFYIADQKQSITDVIPTGLAELDRLFTPNLFDAGKEAGLPRGFVYEFYGPHAGGKSSLCMRLAGQVTKKDKGVAWFDIEHSFVNEWAEAQGMDLSKVIMFESGKHGEHYLDQIEKVAKTGAVDLIVVDSITAMQPYEIKYAGVEIDTKKDRVNSGALGTAGRMYSRFLPNIVAAAKEGNCAVIFINQIRMKIGVMYGNPETTPGGESLKFFASIRCRITRSGDKKGRGIKKGDEEIGIRSCVKLVKSRMGPPDREVIVPIYYNQDVKPTPLDQIIDAALGNKLIKSRSKTNDDGETVQTFTFGELKCEGIEEFKDALDYESIKSIFDSLSAVTPVDKEIADYVKELGEDESLLNDSSSEEDSDIPVEGDPGA